VQVWTALPLRSAIVERLQPELREKRALQIKLQAFIAEEMQEWVKTFPEEFWQELARLEGIRLGRLSLRELNPTGPPGISRARVAVCLPT
jgi:hypothetical protein